MFFKLNTHTDIHQLNAIQSQKNKENALWQILKASSNTSFKNIRIAILNIIACTQSHLDHQH